MRYVSVLLALILLTGCAGLKVDPLTLSADSADLVGKQALSTNALYVQLCATRSIEVERCNAWSKWYSGTFKPTYAAAHAAFRAGSTQGDVTTARAAADRIQQLANQLAIYYITGGK